MMPHAFSHKNILRCSDEYFCWCGFIRFLTRYHNSVAMHKNYRDIFKAAVYFLTRDRSIQLVMSLIVSWILMF